MRNPLTDLLTGIQFLGATPFSGLDSKSGSSTVNGPGALSRPPRDLHVGENPQLVYVRGEASPEPEDPSGDLFLWTRFQA